MLLLVSFLEEALELHEELLLQEKASVEESRSLRLLSLRESLPLLHFLGLLLP